MPENASAWAKVATVTIVVSAYASSATRCGQSLGSALMWARPDGTSLR
jgi:hypothetical protein